MTRTIAIAVATLFATLAPQSASAGCKGLSCFDSLAFAYVDEASNTVWLQTNTGDESNLDCAVGTGPTPLEKGLPLRRTSPVFAEAYQVVLLATASQLPVQINLDKSSLDCRVTGIILDPFGKLSP